MGKYQHVEGYIFMVEWHVMMWSISAILTDDIFNCIFLNENDKIPIKISLKLVPGKPIDNKPASVQIMAWRRVGD